MSKIYVDEIRHSGGAVAAMQIDSGGAVTEPNKEYFQVVLTTQQNGMSDNTANVIDFSDKGTIIHDTKSNFDTATDAYEFDSASGLYLITFSVGLRSTSITSETLQEVAAFLEFSTDSFSSVLSGTANELGSACRVLDNASSEVGSHIVTGNFLYKTTTSGTKVRLKAYSNTSGSSNYTIETVAGDMIAGAAGAQGFGGHNVTTFSVVRMA